MPDGPQRSGLLLPKVPRLLLPYAFLDHRGNSDSWTTTNPAANEAVFLEFQIDDFIDVSGINFAVTTQAGNYDVGLYTAAGILIASKGSTAVPAAGLAQGTFAANQRLSRGRYYAALAWNNAGEAHVAMAFGASAAAANVASRGVYTMAAAFPLPATATFATPTRTNAPLASLELA